MLSGKVLHSREAVMEKRRAAMSMLCDGTRSKSLEPERRIRELRVKIQQVNPVSWLLAVYGLVAQFSDLKFNTVVDRQPVQFLHYLRGVVNFHRHFNHIA